MTAATYPITGGDYERGGEASRQLKDLLKRIGAEPAAVRRVMIAAYEAEMNVVIHTGGGVMQVAVEPDQVDVAVADTGPGIPDIDEAMREGFSTAPPRARELGFGAGMGLPNIKRNSDQFTIRSYPGEGTRLRFVVRLQPAAAAPLEPNSVAVDTERCRKCLRCLPACPTRALRVHGRPTVLPHLCVDCTACMEVCPSNVYGLDAPAEWAAPGPDTVLVLPSAFFAQFGDTAGFDDICAALAEAGFSRVQVSNAWEQALARAVAGYAGAISTRPVLSPTCPAAINLIRMRFPALLPHVAPFLSPVEAVQDDLAADDVIYVVPCPAQHTVLRARRGTGKMSIITPGRLTAWVASHLRSGRTPPDAGASHPPGDRLVVSGMPQVIRFLERAEDGRTPDCGVVELYACVEGCFGAPVWREQPNVARYRFDLGAGAAGGAHAAAEHMAAVRRLRPLNPRGGLRLDPDMRRAIAKLREIEALSRRLPGHDCGVCGAPTCAALAEDVVRGRAALDACAYLEPDGNARSGKEMRHDA